MDTGTSGRVGSWCRRKHGAADLERMLARYRHPEHGYRSALGLLSLARRHGHARLEAACERALSLQIHTYRAVRDILLSGKEKASPVQPGRAWQSPDHEHLRGARAYH